VREDEDVGLEPEFGIDEEVRLELDVGVDEEVGLATENGDGEDILDEATSEMSQSDILISPPASDEEDEVDSERVYVTKRVPFSPSDLGNPVLQRGNTFHDMYEFRKAIKHANVLKRKDLHFKKIQERNLWQCAQTKNISIEFMKDS
jgi:hypothetical protein